MERGLNLLNQRQVKINSNLAILQNEEVPLSFKLFIEHYELEYSMLKIQNVLYGSKLNFFCTFTVFKDFKIGNEYYNATIDYLLDLNDLDMKLDAYSKSFEIWHKLGFMRIGYLFHGDILLLGMKDEFNGEIWRYGSG